MEQILNHTSLNIETNDPEIFSKSYPELKIIPRSIFLMAVSDKAAARKAFEQFCPEWSQYPGAVDVWKRNFSHVEKLFDYGSAVRKVMYTTNAVESINSSSRKVTKKGAFPNENALLKLLYLRITELYKKWNGSKVLNWAMVRNQLATNDKMKARIEKYDHLI